MSSNQPETIEEVLPHEYDGDYECPARRGGVCTCGADEQRAAIGAMVEEIVGEDTDEMFDPGGMAAYGEQQKNALRNNQRQRAIGYGFDMKGGE